MKQDTKQKILEAGAQIIHRKGYHHTGIQEVLHKAGTPKGSFYFYFKNKEDFGIQVIDYFNAMHSAMVSPILEDKSQTPLKRLERLFDHFIGLFKEMGCTCGCPIGNLAQEMGDLSDAFSDKLKTSVESIVGMYKGILEEAIMIGEIPNHLDALETADFIVSGWHGALIRMKIVKDTAPLENHKRMILKTLLKHP